MSSFVIFLVCVQALLIQNAYSQIISAGISNANVGLPSKIGFTNIGAGVPDVASIAQLPVAGPYGGTGNGDLAVGGEMQAAGNAVVTGQVPVIGSVQFSGTIPASGVVSIAGNCACANAL